ncbi:AMP-binding enzyme [delta proteobacterium NaphS2]|nr:AMP-binding enzyme [delta proteobacterium NaphS2]
METSSNESVAKVLENACKSFPERLAMIYLGKSFSYAKLGELIDRFAAGLNSLGVDKGDKVIVYLPNTPQFVIAFYAIMVIGAVPVPISPIYTPNEVGYMSKDCEARAIVCLKTNFGYVKEISHQMPLKGIIYTDLVEMIPWWKKAIGFAFDKVPRGRIRKDENVYSFSDLLKYPASSKTVNADTWKDICRVLYTGGTTGLPKGAPSCHAHLYYGAMEVAECARGTAIAEGKSTIVLTLPLFHALCQAVFSGFVLALGNTAVIMPQPQVDAILECIQRNKADLFLGVPALYRMILDSDRLDQYDLSSLKYCWSGGDILPDEVFNRWNERFGIPLHQLYGSTEGELQCATPLSKRPKLRSVGVFSKAGKKNYKLVDPDTLQAVAEGSTGELLVSAPYFLNCYLNKPEETAASFVNLDGEVYYRTKDMLMMKEGELYFVDRSADVIKHKGYRVSASEIEAVLQDHPTVVAACAVGVPDPKIGERIKAFVVLKEDARGVSARDLTKWCRESLAPYKVPQYIEFRDMLPRSKVGKLLRRDMRDEERRKMDKA